MNRLGIIGCGGAAAPFTSALRSAERSGGFVLSGVFDPDPERRRRFAEEYGTEALSLEKLLDRCDAAALALPPAGDAGETVAIVRQAEHAGLRLIPLAFSWLTGPFSLLAAKFEAGSIPAKGVIRIARYFSGDAADGYPERFLPFALAEDFAFLLKYFGPVSYIDARSTRRSAERGGTYALLTLGFENGAIGHLELSSLPERGLQDGFEYAYRGGLIEFRPDTPSPLAFGLQAAGESSRQGAVKRERVSPLFSSQAEAGLAAAAAFLSDGTPLPVDMHTGLSAALLAFDALESVKTAGAVRPQRR